MNIRKNLKMLVFGILAMFVMVVSVKALPTNDRQPDSIVKTEYASGWVQYNNDLQSAVNSSFVDAGVNKIILLDNVNIAELVRGNIIYTEDCIIELDLAGYTITLTGSDPFMILGSDFTITDSSADKTGTIKAANVAIQVSNGNTLTLEGGNIISTSETAQSGAIEVYGPSELIMNGGNIEGNYGIAAGGNGAKVEMSGGTITANVFAVSGNGSTTQNSDITISGGTLTSNSNAAIYQPQTGSLTITGGNITGKVGVVARQGNVSIKGNPTITANGTKDDTIKVGDATIGGEDVLLPNGVAVIVDNKANNGYSASAKVQIEGGTFNTTGSSVVTYKDESNSSHDITISGGDFSDTVADVYLAENCEQSQSGVVGKVNTIIKGAVSKGEIDAVENAAEGETVVVKVKAYAGYEVSNVTVKGATKGYDVTKNADGTYSFTMPGEQVTVSVEFVEKTSSKPAEDDNIVVEEEVKGDENVTLSTEANDILKESLLNTDDEELKELVESDEDITIAVENEKISKEDLDKEELEKFEKAVEGATVTEFFELNVVVKVDGKADHYLTELSKPITLTIELPKLPEVAKGFTRKYYILREHEGVIEKLDATLTEDGKLSFATDKFSKYAIAYVDEEVKDSVADKNPSTIDNVMAYVSMAIASIGALGITSKKFLKK